MDTGNYRKRVLHKLARQLELPKLTFQVRRRAIATLAQLLVARVAKVVVCGDSNPSWDRRHRFGTGHKGEETMTPMNRLFSRFFLATVLATQVWPLQASAAAGRYDQAIQEQALKILTSKDKWKGITANTEDGIVTLEGSVKLYIDKVDAARKVSKINHADGVRNHIRVETNVPDAELQAKLSDKLSYDRIGYGIMFNALNLKVEDGVVTIGGDVRDYPGRDSAVAIVETTPGVKDVIDEINVLPTSTFDDDLRIRVARAIYGQSTMRKYAMVPEKPIRIIVDKGHVTLYGVVDSKMDKQIAETQAKSVSGAFSVDNKLVVANEKER
jgi:hyperosmotically inducible periplasmic protein